MNVGTLSVLVGVHQFILHPLLLALGWWKAYGFARVRIGRRRVQRATSAWEWEYASLLRPALWVAFLVHDIGYLGKPNMDGPEGETHPELGASIMRFLFGEPWGDFVLLHSRYYAKKLERPVSPLCFADKWVIVLEPAWLYLPRVWLSGELTEFVTNAHNRAQLPNPYYTKDEVADWLSRNPWRWHRAMRSYMRRWIYVHSDGREDTWTKIRHQETAA